MGVARHDAGPHTAVAMERHTVGPSFAPRYSRVLCADGRLDFMAEIRTALLRRSIVASGRTWRESRHWSWALRLLLRKAKSAPSGFGTGRSITTVEAAASRSAMTFALGPWPIGVRVYCRTTPS